MNDNEDDDQGIDLSAEQSVKNVNDLQIAFSIVVGFDLDDFPDKDYAAIFSHSDNGC